MDVAGWISDQVGRLPVYRFGAVVRLVLAYVTPETRGRDLTEVSDALVELRAARADVQP